MQLDPLRAAGSPAAGYWPASLRSLTFLQSKSQALDVELRSCSLNERRSFSLAELRLDVIANPPHGHNNSILSGRHRRKKKVSSGVRGRRVTFFPRPGIKPSPYHCTKSDFGGYCSFCSVDSWVKVVVRKSETYSRFADTSHSEKVTVKQQDMLSHLTPDVCVSVFVCAFVEEFTRRKDVMPSRAAGNVNTTRPERIIQPSHRMDRPV